MPANLESTTAPEPQQGAGYPAIVRWSAVWLFSLSLFVLLLFIVLGRFAIPSADDYCMATGVHYKGLGSFLLQHYLEWSGRYSGNALYAIYPLIFDLFDGYRYFPAILLLTLLTGCAFLLAELFRTRINQPVVILASLILVMVYLGGLTSTASSLYWMAGALSYLSANVLMLFTLGWMLRLSRQLRENLATSRSILMLALLIVVGVGTNETYMLTLTGLMLLAVLAHSTAGGQQLKPWVWLLALTAVCVAVVYLAPGNRLREATFALRHDLTRTLTGSAEMGLWSLIRWLKNPLFIIATLLTPLAIAYGFYRHKKAIKAFTIRPPWLVALPLLTLSIPFLLQIPAWWSMGGWPPHRTVDAIYFVFLISWFLSVGLISLFIISGRSRPTADRKQNATNRPSLNKRGLTKQTTVVLFVLLFSAALWTNGNVQRALDDLFRNGPLFHAYIQDRYQRIFAARAQGRYTLVVPDFAHDYPRTVYFNDILPYPNDWRNACYAAYFGLQTIRRDKNLIKPDKSTPERSFSGKGADH